MIVLDKSMCVRTLNKLQLLGFKVGHQDKSPNYGRQGDVLYWFAPHTSLYYEWFMALL